MSSTPSLSCPTPTAHRRLAEAHRHWHAALDQYQSPEGFRVALNACIQALRNTTFGLQKDKYKINDFDRWYSQHQDRLRADAIMQWIHDARNRVVKAEDLETESILIARLLGTYEDAAAEVADSLQSPIQEDNTTLSATPTLTIPQVLDEVAKKKWPRRFVDQATLSIERRWVASDLRPRELLGVLSYAYGFLWEILNDAHERANLSMPCVVLHEHDRLIGEQGDGRLRCMITSRASRVLEIALENGKATFGGKSWVIDWDPELYKLAKQRYKVGPVRLDRYPQNLTDLVPVYVQKALAVLRSGEDHAWMILYHKGLAIIQNKILLARNTADKRRLSQEVADDVATNHVDGIVEIGEAWQSPVAQDDEGYLLPAAEHSDRSEVLVVHAENAAGDLKSVVVPFSRSRDGELQIGSPVDTSEIRNNFLEPTRAVWRSWQI